MPEQSKRVFVSGSSGDPTHMAHVAQVRYLLARPDALAVWWILAGQQGGKELFAEAHHRNKMALMSFNVSEFLGHSGAVFRLELGDTKGVNTPTIVWLERLQRDYQNYQIVFCAGADLVTPRSDLLGLCPMQKWVRGDELWEKFHFLIFPRPGYPDPHTLALPPHTEVADIATPDISGTEIRNMVAEGRSINGLVAEVVELYIKQHELYQKR